MSPVSDCEANEASLSISILRSQVKGGEEKKGGELEKKVEEELSTTARQVPPSSSCSATRGKKRGHLICGVYKEGTPLSSTRILLDLDKSWRSSSYFRMSGWRVGCVGWRMYGCGTAGVKLKLSGPLVETKRR